MLIVDDMVQGSEAWIKARIAIATASKFTELLMPTGKPTTGAKRKNYMNTLLYEWMTGQPTETYQSYWMRRGSELEPESRLLYAMLKDVDPIQVGLVYKNESKLIACSPDSLINDDGLWESKSFAPHNHIDCLLEANIPPKHIQQVQGQMWICERDWCDFQSYCPGTKPMIIRVYRDTRFIKLLADEIECFVEEMLEKREKLEALK